ncbi:MAG: AAA family ATPase [Candidatus Kapaibacterium sp.]
MQKLIDFVNQGILPFIGRTTLRERLQQFWKESFEGQEMSVLLVTGESGVGKSRLVEELTPFVSESGGIVVWGKLYPDSATLAPVLSRALLYSEGGRRLLRNEPESTISSVTASLRRLVGVRPTLLVLEDVHLLEEDTIGELMILLDGIAEEPIGLICISRPGETSARALLSRYLVNELELEGLTPQEVNELWQILFDSPPSSDILDILCQRTRGNPMALRTALRNFLKAGALVREEKGGWRLTVPIEEFGDQLDRYIQVFSDGMIAHLSTLEQQKGILLSSLGESFAAITARKLLEEDGDEMLNRLAYKGIFSHPGSLPVPLAGTFPGDEMFVFTHTLVHANLLHRGVIPFHPLMKIVGEGYPLYSSVPYQMIREGLQVHSLSEFDREEVRRIVKRITEDARKLDGTSDWQVGAQLLETAEAIASKMSGVWSENDERGVTLCLFELRLALKIRENHTDHYAQLVDQFEELTRDLEEGELHYRLSALTYRYQQNRRQKDLEDLKNIWEEVESLLKRFPTLRYTSEFVRFLNIAGRSTSSKADMEWNPLIEDYAEGLLRDEGASEKIKYEVRSQVIPLVIWQFHTPEELEHRLQQAEDLLALAPDSIFVQTRVMALYEGVGKYREGLRFAERLIPRFRAQGLRRDLTQARLFRLYAQTGLHFPPHLVASELREILFDAPEEIKSQVMIIASWRLAVMLLNREEYEEAKKLVQNFSQNAPNSTYSAAWMLVNVRERGLDALSSAATLTTEEFVPSLMELCQQIATGELQEKDLLQAFRTELERPILTRLHIVEVKLLIEILERLQEGAFGVTLKPEIQSAIVGTLDWFVEHDLLPYAMPTLDVYAKYLTQEQNTFWIERIRMAMAAEAYSPVGRAYELTQVQMIGDISIKPPGEETHRIRGGRIRTILGLMVANLLSEKKLTYREFCFYASGGLDDPERARKMTSMALLRLRETYGEEILNDIEGVPALNEGLVQVDVIRLVTLLREGLDKIRQGSFLRVRFLLMEALQIHGGQVPFPTLYDDLFESLRDDIDYLLRTTLIEGAQGFTREGDLEGVEEILKYGVEIMPDDEELVDLLLKTLRSLGKHAEAQRLDLRLEGSLIE